MNIFSSSGVRDITDRRFLKLFLDIGLAEGCYKWRICIRLSKTSLFSIAFGILLPRKAVTTRLTRSRNQSTRVLEKVVWP